LGSDDEGPGMLFIFCTWFVSLITKCTCISCLWLFFGYFLQMMAMMMMG
jgi:hypothetical protein